MKALVHAELLKLRGTRMSVGLLVATLAMVALTVVVSLPKADATDDPVPLGDPGLLSGSIGGSLGVPTVVAALIGVLAFTQEFRYGTVTSTYLVEPRRSRVLVAKWLAAVVGTTFIAAVSLALSVPLSVALIRARDGDLTVAGQFWQTIAAAFVVMAAYGVIGVSLGALVRNQVVAVVGVLVWMLAVDWTVIPPFPSVGRWLPAGAANALLQLGPELGLEGRLLPAAVGGVVLVGYALVAMALALVLAPRKDIL